CPVGPWIETDLEIADIPVRSRLNGEDRQSQRTSAMIFSPAFLIAFVSRVMSLQPGDLLLTGTPEGVGPMAPGDIVEIEVGGIGILRNPVEVG
ncbi:MAG TPA: fumarylacetoacetate hydrolase family protein, partial [Thermomicrobiales bacterium]|nr:fumarylacetoacetate hydrolase family protein [Thermomicrobiales bacterium]